MDDIQRWILPYYLCVLLEIIISQPSLSFCKSYSWRNKFKCLYNQFPTNNLNYKSAWVVMQCFLHKSMKWSGYRRFQLQYTRKTTVCCFTTCWIPDYDAKYKLINHISLKLSSDIRIVIIQNLPWFVSWLACCLPVWWLYYVNHSRIVYQSRAPRCCRMCVNIL